MAKRDIKNDLVQQRGGSSVPFQAQDPNRPADDNYGYTPPPQQAATPTAAPTAPSTPAPAPVLPFNQYLQKNPGQVDIWAYMDSYLGDKGLGDLSSWAQNLLVEYGDALSSDMFQQRIRETPSYKVRFKANETRKQQGLPPLKESEIIASENAYRQVAQMAGLPKGFYDSPDDFANLIAKDVSPQEYQTRVLEGVTTVRTDPIVQQQMGRLFDMGLSEGDVVAYFLDEKRAVTTIQQNLSAAKIAASAQKTGFGQLDLRQASSLAGQGVTDEQARSGFANLAEQSALLDPLATEGGGKIGTDTAIAAQFEGNAKAKDVIGRRREQRTTAFQGGGNFQTSRNGSTGVGSAS